MEQIECVAKSNISVGSILWVKYRNKPYQVQVTNITDTKFSVKGVFAYSYFGEVKYHLYRAVFKLENVGKNIWFRREDVR